MNTPSETKLIDAVLAHLTCNYVLPNGAKIQGQSISQLSSELRDGGWKRVSNLSDLESTLESLGFKMVRAQGFRWNSSRKPGSPHFKLGNTARVVTL